MYQKRIVLTRSEFKKSWRGCLRKRNYDSLEAAIKVINRMTYQQTANFESLHTYKCPFFNHWHIGHDRFSIGNTNDTTRSN